MTKPIWFDYSERKGGFAPVIDAKIKVSEKVSGTQEFIIDSGASSLAPSFYVSPLVVDFFSIAEEETPLQDAHGKLIKGRAIDVVVSIKKIPSFTERIWFASEFRFGLLGQTWFENIRVLFHNLPSSKDGRRFGFDPLPSNKDA